MELRSSRSADVDGGIEVRSAGGSLLDTLEVWSAGGGLQTCGGGAREVRRSATGVSTCRYLPQELWSCRRADTEVWRHRSMDRGGSLLDTLEVRSVGDALLDILEVWRSGDELLEVYLPQELCSSIDALQACRRGGTGNAR